MLESVPILPWFWVGTRVLCFGLLGLSAGPPLPSSICSTRGIGRSLQASQPPVRQSAVPVFLLSCKGVLKTIHTPRRRRPRRACTGRRGARGVLARSREPGLPRT